MRRLTVPVRSNLSQVAQEYGFAFPTINGAVYWDESACYAFTLPQVELDIEQPTLEIHQMAMTLVDEAVRSEELMARLALPRSLWDAIAASWKRRDPHLYGRMDFSYGGTGPAKLLELNYDTPTSLYEASFFQWVWLEHMKDAGLIPAHADQYNSIQEALIMAFGHLAKTKAIGSPLHMAAVRGSVEDQGTVDYLEDCARQAGLTTARVDIEEIGVARAIDPKDRRVFFSDTQDRPIRTLFKLYPLEMMFEDEGGVALPTADIQLIEPLWKSVLSNKGVLPLLWERHKGHPNLLEAVVAPDPAAPPPVGFVRKPFFAREGANVTLHRADGTTVAQDGPYDGGPVVWQSLAELPVRQRPTDTGMETVHPLIGSWVVGDSPCGMGVREDSTLITTDTARFVPHYID